MKALTRIISTLVSATLLSTYAFSVSASEIEDNNFGYVTNALQDMGYSNETIANILANRIDPSTPRSGSSCYYYSVMSNGASFTSAFSTLFYKWSDITYIGYTVGEAATSLGISVNTTGPVVDLTSPYWSIQQTYTSSSTVTPSGSLHNYKFKGSISSGTVLTATSHSNISIQLIYPGDTNNDGLITAGDLTLLLQYIDDPSTSISARGKIAADCNGDGFINNNDSTILARVLANDPTATFW